MKPSLVSLTVLLAVSFSYAAADDKQLYSERCASCHGSNAEKKALSTSRVISTMTGDEIRNALQSYRDGSYKGKMRQVKRSIAGKLDDAQIDALASYISTLDSHK